MTEPKLISPMLDNFVMGDPISSHHGVRCCPAMEKDTDHKYIVKIISVPASQTQLDALLLSGAYSDRASALSYFSKLCDTITEEVNVLNKLSELEGYLPIEACQIEPMEDGSGFDVYLLSSYRHTLQRQLRRGPMTHLGALNLGLDLCAALSVARRMGYLYADLKPGNIYVNGSNEYRIGDIGFLKLDALKYTSLPERYRSAYTAPEITDAYSQLNTTIDVYAVGLILYQVFNDGNLPFKEEVPPAEEFPAPAYADYEMAEIILKACAPDPAARWQDPIELGQALVSYMQRNGAHDTPIVPVQEAATQEDLRPASEEADDNSSKNAAKDSLAGEVMPEEPVAAAQAPDTEDLEEISEELIYTEDKDGNLTFLESPVDETMEEQDAADINYEEVSEEVSGILQQADALIAHDAPAPVVQPDPIDVPVPPPIVPEEEVGSEEDAQDSSQDSSDAIEAEEDADTSPAEEAVDAETEDVETEDEKSSEYVVKKRRKGSGWIVKTILILLAAALLATGLYFYKTFYLQTIDAIVLEAGNAGELTVKVLSQVDESNLSVVCTDTYGNQKTCPVEDGKAKFTDLTTNSAYTIKVITAGFHRLIGNTTAAYTTPDLTQIIQFTAVTGSEDGSVILSFTINGPDSEQWKISYTADDGTEESIAFTGHMVTLTGLTLGKEYAFTLEPVSKLQITGTAAVTHVAKAIVKPENLVVTGCLGDTLTAQWTVREDADITSWTVRCYNSSYDETIVVSEPSASFTIPDDSASYTLEVTASGMSVSERVFVSENSITVKDFTVDASDPKALNLSWTPAKEAPEGGWILQYSVDGSAPEQIPCPSGNRVSVSPVIPGSSYRFVLQTANSETVLGGTHIYTTAAAKDFSGYDVTASDMEFKMCLTPSNSNWDRYDLSGSDYTTQFSVGKKASFLVRLKRAYRTSGDTIETLFVIHDEAGAVVSTSASSSTWTKMWYKNYCELDIPSIPQVPGKYTVSVYFNGAFANKTAFTVTD